MLRGLMERSFCRDITKIGSNKRPSLSPPPFQLINDVGPEKVSQNSLAATWVKKIIVSHGITFRCDL